VTITKATYTLCKSVVAAQARQELQELILKLSTSAGSSDGHFGYLARRQGCQLLGFLIVEQERATISLGSLPVFILPLADSERMLFRSAHAEITHLNQLCVEPVLSRWPATRLALDPYSQHVQLAESPKANPAKRLLSEVERAELTQAFVQHSGVRAILETPAALVGQLDDNQIRAAVLSLLGLIHQAGVGHVPSAIEQLAFQAPRNHPQRGVTRFFVALLSVRESLRSLNQMIYQAILADRVPVLDEDAVISVSDTHGNVLGTSAVIAFQPDADTIVLEPGDIALVKPIANYHSLDGLARLEDLRFEHSRDYGSTYTVSTRLLDNDLSPFGNLVESL